MFLYQVEGSTTAECAGNLGDGTRFARIGARAVAPGQTSGDDLTTPIVLKPLHAGASWCLVSGAAPKTTTSSNTNLVLDYAGFVVNGTFAPTASAPTGSPDHASAANP